MSFLTPRCEIIVLGAGRSGMAATRLLIAKGARVNLCDDAPLEKLKHLKESGLIDHPQLTVSLGTTIGLVNENTHSLILSPGIASHHPLVIEAKSRGIVVLNEIDLAFLLMPSRTIIGITGTNGKSTTTVMVEHIIKCQKARVWAGGNLGQPLCDMLWHDEKVPFDYIVLELSSYQLESLSHLRLDSAIILNITPDHLDRYNSIKDYSAAKMRIAKLLKASGAMIINDDIKALLPADHGVLNLKSFKSSDFNHELSSLNIKGEHNRENAVAAALCAKSLGISEHAITLGLNTFTPLPHRCELITTIDGITFINDSKGTTVEAVKKALLMTEGPVHLLLGGVAKGEDFSALSPRFFTPIQGFYVFGQSKNKILDDLKNTPSYAYENLEHAFYGALEKAKSGHTILLSPGCASFDQYSDFNERGEHFRALVAKRCA